MLEDSEKDLGRLRFPFLLVRQRRICLVGGPHGPFVPTSFLGVLCVTIVIFYL